MNNEDLRLQSALAALDRNRAMIRARFLRDKTGVEMSAEGFPRSKTFRWLLAAAGNRQLIGVALQALLGKYPFGRVLAMIVQGQRPR
jgi:hypothetical protein